MTAPTGSGWVDVLAVLDAEIASLPTMAAMASHGGTGCDPAEAIERLTQARATVEALVRTVDHVAYALTQDGRTSDGISKEAAANRLRAGLVPFGTTPPATDAVGLPDEARDESVWALIDIAERCGAIKDEGEDGLFWTLNLDGFFALEAKMHDAVNAMRYRDATPPAGGGDALLTTLECALECIERGLYIDWPECTCEPCPECGKQPNECSDTDCAQTCQCSMCDHCCAIGNRDALREQIAALNDGRRLASSGGA